MESTPQPRPAAGDPDTGGTPAESVSTAVPRIAATVVMIRSSRPASTSNWAGAMPL